MLKLYTAPRRVVNFFGASFFMRKQVLSLILLAVLIPLVNLGPSLHRLSCFGLHGDCEHSHCVAKHHCCEGHSTCGNDVVSHHESEFLPGFSVSDCPLCQFFAHYNAIDCIRLVAFESHVFCDVVTGNCVAAFIEFVPEQARGPPICSFVLLS